MADVAYVLAPVLPVSAEIPSILPDVLARARRYRRGSLSGGERRSAQEQRENDEPQ